ncbi:MAG: hypothetical protein NTX82_02815 [Candidatus Parcubacteria bacterium]|nr:hypothetical protein [Candidatus Parcubacteria bacterium]
MAQPMMETYCAWCGKFLGLIKCAAAQTGNASHGICEACFKKAAMEIAEIQMPFKEPRKKPELEK